MFPVVGAIRRRSIEVRALSAHMCTWEDPLGRGCSLERFCNEAWTWGLSGRPTEHDER